jgi:hypothetical protein
MNLSTVGGTTTFLPASSVIWRLANISAGDRFVVGFEQPPRTTRTHKRNNAVAFSTTSLRLGECAKRKKVPPTSRFRGKGTGYRRDFGNSGRPVRPERLSASVQKLQSTMGRSPGLKNRRLVLQNVNRHSHHSGATARDSHPFPYSPRQHGAPRRFSIERAAICLIAADSTTSPT